MDKQVAPSPGQILPARAKAGQCARAAAVGTALGLAVTVFALTLRNEELEALGELAAAVFAAWALSWPLLRIARVQRPWLTALLAPVALVALTRGLAMLDPYTAALGQWLQAATVFAVAVVTGGGYAAAAFVGGPGARPHWRVIVATAVLAMIPAQLVVTPIQRAAHEADEAAGKAAQLAAYPHPLFAPKLPGYTITEYHVEDPGSFFAFWLRPTSTPQQAAGASPNIAVFQTPAPARFNPPADCTLPDLGNNTNAAVPCAAAGPGIWRVAKPANGWVSLYLARRGDRVIEIGTGSAAIPESDLARAATTLRRQMPADA
ncbi:hypothetical protein AB0L41_46640 [Amycolatopsis mediterranei]|uniref:hypothetical protein n=1 Tax=Amycolatopsis mediterranei TaxID=33910 RepID=UPI003413B24E